VEQQVFRLQYSNLLRFFAALEAWKADPSKFLGRPRLPRYKHKQQGRHLLLYTIQALSIPALRNHMICPSMLGVTVQTRQQLSSRYALFPAAASPS
jgi:putative transposase